MSKSKSSSLMAVTLLATVLLTGCEGGVLLPGECSDPAPLHGEWDPESPDRYGVKIAEGFDLETVAAELEVDPGIEVRQIFSLSGWLDVTMDVEQRDVVRCDSRVILVEHSEWVEWP